MKPVLTMLIGGLAALAQGLQPDVLLQPPTDTWPTYNGDYSGRRYSPLDQINRSNAGSLTLAWAFQANSAALKSTPLEVNGILYFSVPDHVWAVDARTGDSLWHYEWKDEGGHLVGNRGVGMYGNWLYFMTPDGWLISLNAADGKEHWRMHIADVKLQYFTTMASLVIRNHV